MKKLIKVMALALGLIMLLGVFAGCKKESTDDGPYAYAYITASSPATLDPGVAQYDSDMVKYIGLLFESLFKIDENGKVKKALCKDYYTKEIDGEKRLYIELNDTHWSDGVSVTASNIVYAWKRLLEPGYEGPGAATLLCLKNAVKVKEGVEKMMTIDDIGLVELNESLIEIRFENPDYDETIFIQGLASPYLAPVREELVKSNPLGWATVDVEDPTTIATNGPFSITAWTKKGMTLKRNNYYYLKGITNEDKQEYVNVDKIYIKFTDLDSAEALFDATDDGSAEDDFLFYLGDGTDYNAKTQDMLATTVIYLNEANKAFNSAEKRRTLAGALDFDELAEETNCRVAEGVVPYGVFETTKASKLFRKVGGDVLYEYADGDTKVSGTVTISVLKGNARHEALAKSVQTAWKAKGLTVKINSLVRDKYLKVMETGDYDAIILDMHAYTTDAFSVLAQFSLKYSGRALQQNENYEYGFIAPTFGYASEEYNEIMDKVFSSDNVKERAELLHEAEDLLLSDMAVIPLCHVVDSYVTTQISKLSSSWYAFRNFNDVKVKDYTKYIEIEDEKNAEERKKSGQDEVLN